MIVVVVATLCLLWFVQYKYELVRYDAGVVRPSEIKRSIIIHSSSLQVRCSGGGTKVSSPDQPRQIFPQCVIFRAAAAGRAAGRGGGED